MKQANYKYPEYILKMVRQHQGLDDNDCSKDEEFQSASPEWVFDAVLEWNGLIHMDYKIHSWIEGVYGIALCPDDLAPNDQSREDFVRGLGNLFRAFPRVDSCEVVTMEMDENEIVHVLFKSGYTKKANVAMDSRRSMISDIINQALR